MSTKKHAPPQIELVKLTDLEVERDFNPRQNFKENVRELKSLVEARGGIDPSVHVVQYVERDGRKLIRGGHTLYAAAQALGLKEVPACRTEMDAITEQVNLITSNTGHPLSQYEQGTVYTRLRDGKLKEGVDLVSGPDGEKREPTEDDWHLCPHGIAEIAEAVGFTKEHIRRCIVIRESPTEIADLVLGGKIGANAVIIAQANVKSVPKQVAIIKAAIKAAEAEGKESATDKHVKAVKPDFLEPKKQIAAPVTDEQPEVPELVSRTPKAPREHAPQEAPTAELFADEGAADEAPHPVTTTGEEIPADKLALFDGNAPAGREDQVARWSAFFDDAMNMPNLAIAITAEEQNILAIAIVKSLETSI